MNILYTVCLVFNRPYINAALGRLKREAVPYREREREWRLIFAVCNPKDLHEVSYRVTEILRHETKPIIEATKNSLLRLANENAGEYIRDLLRGFEILLRTGLANEKTLLWLGMGVVDHNRTYPFEKLDVVGVAKRARQLMHENEAKRNPRRRNVQFS